MNTPDSTKTASRPLVPVIAGASGAPIAPVITLHRFLVEHQFYPILLSTLLALAMYTARVVLSRGAWVVYANLVWNLFLAWIPYMVSLFAVAYARAVPRGWLLLLPLGVLWMAFFPNAPYLVTDFLHLETRPYIPLWYDILLLVTFVWSGLFLAIASLRAMHLLVARYLGQIAGWLFAGAALALSGLGIYLGRFERWNSWDLLFHPRRILADVLSKVANPLDNLNFVGFTLLFTAFLMVVYLTFVGTHRVNKE